MPSVLLRAPGRESPPRVTNMELFFDLVYVFAITQLSDLLYASFDPGHPFGRTALHALILFSAVWWAWNYTAWATNWVDPDRPLTALVMVVMMGLGLVMAAAIPEAWGARGLAFAIAYVALGLVRTGFVAWAFGARDPMRTNNLRLLSWLAIAAVAWILGGALHGEARLLVWLLAAVLDVLAPIHGFWLPRLGRLAIEAWKLTGTHLAERYQLVLIVALGESVLRVGLTFSEVHGSLAVDVAFVVGFLVSAALWAAYFLGFADRGAAVVAASEDRARLGRSGYAYAHALMVAGVILTAVAIRLTIDDPEATPTLASTIVMLGGPALYLVGLGMFVRSAGFGPGARPLAALVVLAVLALAALVGAERLVLAICVALVLTGLAAAMAAVAARARAGGD